MYGATLWEVPVNSTAMETVVVQDIFQSKLDSIFDGMKGVTGITDDMIRQGADEKENFLNFMEKCMSNSLTHNADKIQFKQDQVSFFGHYWLKDGISLDQRRLRQ